MERKLRLRMWIRNVIADDKTGSTLALYMSLAMG